MDADRIHQELAAPGHKTARGLTCECQRVLGSDHALRAHQLKPWMTDEQVAMWKGNPNV